MPICGASNRNQLTVTFRGVEVEGSVDRRMSLKQCDVMILLSTCGTTGTFSFNSSGVDLQLTPRKDDSPLCRAAWQSRFLLILLVSYSVNDVLKDFDGHSLRWREAGSGRVECGFGAPSTRWFQTMVSTPVLTVHCVHVI